MCESKYNETWSKSAANEFGRLAQGVGGRYKGTNTIFFIHKNRQNERCHVRRFPIFRLGCCGEDDRVVDVAEIPIPTVFEKLFFEKVARLIQYTCDCNPEYSVEAFDWDWASFHKNILLPNRMHIRSVMQLSDTITDRVVYSLHFLLNEWNGDDDEENDEDVNVRFETFFSVEDLDF